MVREHTDYLILHNSVINMLYCRLCFLASTIFTTTLSNISYLLHVISSLCQPLKPKVEESPEKCYIFFILVPFSDEITVNPLCYEQHSHEHAKL